MPFTLQNMTFQHAKGHVLISHLMPFAKKMLFYKIISPILNIIKSDFKNFIVSNIILIIIKKRAKYLFS